MAPTNSRTLLLLMLPLVTTFQLTVGRRCPTSGRRRAPCMLGEEPATADEMAKMWKVLKLDAGGHTLAPASGEWEVSTVQVEITRTLESPGLGVMLEEYGEDGAGAGLTLITGLADGGNAALSAVDLQPGDAIVNACGAKTEGFNYDLTIDALVSLPAAPAPAVLTVKRLVKLLGVKCTVIFPKDEGRADKIIRLPPGRLFRQALLMNQIKMGSCNEDLQCLCNCGMVVRKGRKLLVPEDSQERQMLKKEPDWRLTCRAKVGKLEQDEEMVIRIRPDIDNIMAPKDPAAWRT